MWRIVAQVSLCTLAGCLLGYLFGLAIQSISPFFGDRLLGTDDSTMPGLEFTPGLNVALGLANGAWMGFLLGIVATLVEAFLKAKRIAAGLK